MRTKAKMTYAGALFAGLLAAVFTSSPVHAAGLSDASQASDCQTNWRASEAYDHCSSATVSYVTVEVEATTGTMTVNRCQVSGSCSITVNVDDTRTTFTPSVDVTSRPVDLDGYDICFAADSTATSGFSATVKDGCASTETDSDDATSNGLSSS